MRKQLIGYFLFFKALIIGWKPETDLSNRLSYLTPNKEEKHPTSIYLDPNSNNYSSIEFPIGFLFCSKRIDSISALFLQISLQQLDMYVD